MAGWAHDAAGGAGAAVHRWDCSEGCSAKLGGRPEEHLLHAAPCGRKLAAAEQGTNAGVTAGICCSGIHCLVFRGNGFTQCATIVICASKRKQLGMRSSGGGGSQAVARRSARSKAKDCTKPTQTFDKRSAQAKRGRRPPCRAMLHLPPAPGLTPRPQPRAERAPPQQSVAGWLAQPPSVEACRSIRPSHLG